MKVYILWTGYEDTHGVYSTREKAEAARDAYHAARTFQFKRPDDYSIIEETLDETPSEI